MTAKDFRIEQDYPYNHFTRLTSTGIAPDYDNIDEYAKKYHQEQLKLLDLHDVVVSEAESETEVCPHCKSDMIGRRLNEKPNTKFCWNCTKTWAT